MEKEEFLIRPMVSEERWRKAYEEASRKRDRIIKRFGDTELRRSPEYLQMLIEESLSFTSFRNTCEAIAQIL